MSKETILVVDDERNIVELTALYLRQEGYRVLSAADGGRCGLRRCGLVLAMVICDSGLCPLSLSCPLGATLHCFT